MPLLMEVGDGELRHLDDRRVRTIDLGGDFPNHTTIAEERDAVALEPPGYGKGGFQQYHPLGSVVLHDPFQVAAWISEMEEGELVVGDSPAFRARIACEDLDFGLGFPIQFMIGGRPENKKGSDVGIRDDRRWCDEDPPSSSWLRFREQAFRGQFGQGLFEGGSADFQALLQDAIAGKHILPFPGADQRPQGFHHLRVFRLPIHAILDAGSGNQGTSGNVTLRAHNHRIV